MSFAFEQIPTNIRTPGAFLEVDPSQASAGVGSFPLRGLIIGQRTSAGTLAVGVPTRISAPDQAAALAGAGSMAARMAAAWFAENSTSEVDLIVLDDLGGAVANVVNVTFGGTPAAGVVAIYVAGARYQISVAGSSAVAAQAFADAVGADTASPFAAAVNPGDDTQVILTAKNGGEVSNTLDVRVAHLAGEEIPSGVTVTVADTQSGAGDPDITATLAAIAGVQYDILVHPYTTTANLALLETELESRATALEAQPGHAITAAVGLQGVLATLGDGRNSPHSTILGLEPFPGVPCERAAAVAGLVAFHGSTDPARPFQNLRVQGFAPAPEDRFTPDERGLLLFDGISTLKVSTADAVLIERLVSTYQTNDAGGASDAYLDLNTLLSISFFRKAYVARMLTRYPRHKLADDGGTPPGPGTAIVTPKVFEAESVAFYRDLIDIGLCEDLEGFKADSVYQRNASDRNRLDVLLAPNFVNQFRISATLLRFRL